MQASQKTEHAIFDPLDLEEVFGCAPKINGKVARLTPSEIGTEGEESSYYEALSNVVTRACDRFFARRGMTTTSFRDQIRFECRDRQHATKNQQETND